MSANKDYRPILDKLRADGWSLDPTANGHLKAVPPDKTKPLVHFSLSNEPRALRNTLRDLRRSGFTWDEPEGEDEPGEAPEAEETVDELFASLKHAKDYRDLAKTQAEDAREALRRAGDAARLAEDELASAETTLARVKARFDKAFGG